MSLAHLASGKVRELYDVGDGTLLFVTSSRLWPADQWEPGGAPPSFDKRPLRDWLEATGWDKTPPPPLLPADVVDASRARYGAAHKRITWASFADWPGVGR